MPFRVGVDELHRFARSLTDLGDQADQARAYAGEHLAISAAEGNIFRNVVAEAATLRHTLDAHHAHLAALLRGAGGELTRTAEAYEATDDAGAADLDLRYRALPR